MTLAELKRESEAVSASAARQDLQRTVLKLLKQYRVETVRSAVIRHWAAINSLSLNQLEAGEATGPFLEHEDSRTVEDIVKQLAAPFPNISIKDLEGVFESFIDAERRKAQGAVYTPAFIIDYLVHHALAMGWQNRTLPARICDPSCGSAGFLISAALILEAEHAIPLEQAFKECLVGFDNDAWAIRHARCLIELYLASRRIPLPARDLRLYVRDALLSEPEQLWAASGFDQGFDVVATNPPYVKLQNIEIEYRSQLLDKYPEFTMGSFSLAMLFLVAGHKMLAREGCLAMITQNNLFTSLAGKEVRRYLQEKRCIRRVIDFGHHKVFRRASAYTCLMFLGTNGSDAFEFESLSSGVNPETLSKARFSPVRFDSLHHAKWRLAKADHVRNLNYIESIGKPLGSIASIKVGFATLKDSVFLVRDAGDHCVANPRGSNLFTVERSITRPAVKIAELNKQDDLESNNRRIIFPYEKIKGKYRLMPEERLKSLYPQTFEYLLACRAALERRDKGRRHYEGWYAWGRTQGREARGPKLLTKTFSRTPQFFLDGSDQLFCNGYGVYAREPSSVNDGLPIEALERILNSKVMHYYLKLTSFQIEGDYQCYQKNFIERFGIVEMTGAQIKELLRIPKHERDGYVANLYGLRLAEIKEIL